MRLELGPKQMMALEGEKLEDLVQMVLANIKLFNAPLSRARFQGWLDAQPGSIQALAARRPPDRLYRVISDNEREGKGAPMLAGVVIGYMSGTRGGPPQCGVFILGIKSGSGSYEEPIFVPADTLEDVTERAQAGKLVFGGPDQA